MLFFVLHAVYTNEFLCIVYFYVNTTCFACCIYKLTPLHCVFLCQYYIYIVNYYSMVLHAVHTNGYIWFVCFMLLSILHIYCELLFCGFACCIYEWIRLVCVFCVTMLYSGEEHCGLSLYKNKLIIIIIIIFYIFRFNWKKLFYFLLK